MSASNRQLSNVTLESFARTRKFAEIFAACYAQLTIATKRSSIEKVIVRLTLTAISKGGLSNPRLVLSLIHQILIGELEINYSKFGPYTEFDPEKPDEGNAGFRRWFIENETLANIVAMTYHPEKRKFRDISEKRLLTLVKKQFCAIADLKCFSSLSKLCEAGADYAMTHDSIGLSSYLKYYILGQTNSTSICADSFHALQNRSIKQITEQKEPTLETQSPHIHVPPKVQLSYQDSEFLKRLHSALNDKNTFGEAVPVTKSMNDLIDLSDSSLLIQQSVLCDFFIQKLQAGEIKRSSARTYLSQIGKSWLEFTRNVDLNIKDEFDMTELFEQMLAATSHHLSNADKKITLKQLFQFANNEFGFTLPVFDTVEYSQIDNVRNYFINENQFAYFLNQLGQWRKTITGQGLVLSAILIGRCGLRPSEVLKLRVCDIEQSPQRFAFTRQNKFGTNKSFSARRKIPLALMLIKEELKLFNSYFKRRLVDTEGRPNALLFSKAGDVDHCYSLSDYNNVFSSILSEICGERITTYHLRHKSLSSLMLALQAEMSELHSLTPYTKKRIDKMQAYFATQTSRDVNYEIASIAGHLSPATTYQNYLHFADLILFEHQKLVSTDKDIHFWHLLSGISKNTLTKYCSNKVPNFNEVQKIMLSKLRVISQTEDAEDSPTEKFRAPGRIITFVDCLTALRKIDDNETCSQISDSMDIDVSLIHCWHEQALKARNLKTSRGAPRLFPNNDTARLTPINPASKYENIRAEQMISDMRVLYPDKEKRLRWFISYVVQNSLNSKSYLAFKNVEDYKKFLLIAMLFSEPKEWEVVLESPNTYNGSEMREWQDIDEKVKLTIEKKGKKSPKKIRANVHFLHPDPKINDRKEFGARYSSNLLKFVCHVLGIMMSQFDG